MRIYCDGIFDLFHKGHLQHFQKIHTFFSEEIQLVVGVISDEMTIKYKRKPVFNEIQRCKIINSLELVNEAFITDLMIINEDFISKYNIDYVIHAFNNEEDKKKQYIFFEHLIKKNKFIEIGYNQGISTTNIIDSYFKDDKIHDNKKLGLTTDIHIHMSDTDKGHNILTDPKKYIEKIVNTLSIHNDNKILEVECGSGILSTFLQKYDYYGLDNSLPSVTKQIQLLDNIVLCFTCTDIIFKKKYFDFTIINSKLESLSSKEDIDKMIHEIERITKKGVYIANIRDYTKIQKIEKHNNKCTCNDFVIDRNYFIGLGYTIERNLGDVEQYDVYKLMQKKN